MIVAALDRAGAAAEALRRGAKEPLDAGAFAISGSGVCATQHNLCGLEGWLTNQQDLARELGVDAADVLKVLAAGYERWGEELPSRCEGQFALFVWDRRRQRGVIARDPLGHRSVYLWESAGRLLLATEVAPLLRLLPTRPRPDATAVGHWLARSGIPDDLTLYDGVRRLLPGRLLRLDREGWTRRRYWQPRHDVGSIGSRGEAVHLLRTAMGDAVERAARASDDPAVLLSGGFDSGAVCALLRPSRAYSTVFPQVPDADESGRIAAVRDALGLGGGVRAFAGGSAVRPSIEFLLAHELPPVSPNGFVWRPLIHQAAAEGVSVVLDGEGGDELLGCSPYLLADRLRTDPRSAVALARRVPGMGQAPRPRWVLRALTKYGVRGLLPVGAHRRARAARRWQHTRVPWLRADLEARVEATDPWGWKAAPGPRWRAGLVHAVVDGSEALGAQEHLRREAALCGVVARHPFRDPLLLDVVLTIDPALMFDPRHDRPLAREAMRGLLPDAVRLSEHKPDFNALLVTAFIGQDAPLVRQLLGPGSSIGAYVRPDALRARLDAAGTATAPGGVFLDLWRAVTLECWLRLQSDAPALQELLAT